MIRGGAWPAGKRKNERQMHIIVFMVQTGAFALLFAKNRMKPNPSIILFYCYLANIVLALEYFDALEIMPRPGNYYGEENANFSSTLYFFSLFFLIFPVSFIGEKTLLTDVYKSLSKNVYKSRAYFLAVSYFLFFIETVSIDWSMALNYYYYGDFNASNGLAVKNGITEAVHSAFYSFCILIFLLSGILIALRRYYMALLFAPVTIFAFLVRLSGHSRLAFLYVLAFALGINIVRRPVILNAVVIFIALFSFIYALAGRGNGYEGLGNIWLNIQGMVGLGNSPAVQSQLSVSQLLRNIFEGVYVISDGFTFTTTFNEIYIWLSFSPFPSAVDGFNSIRDSYIQSLFYWVPMPAPIEAWNFGYSFFIFYHIVIFASLSVSARLEQGRFAILASGIGIFTCISVIIGFAYPVRTIFRFILLPGIFASFLLLINARKRSV
jgi:hypothetical protein